MLQFSDLSAAMRGLGVGLTPADFALVVDALDPNRNGSVDLRDLYKELSAAGCSRSSSAPDRRLHCIRCALCASSTVV